MTDEVLKKSFEKMTVATYQMWTNDIAAGNYKVVKLVVDIPPPLDSKTTPKKDSKTTPQNAPSPSAFLPLDPVPTQTQ
jgi:hypothetical protein